MGVSMSLIFGFRFAGMEFRFVDRRKKRQAKVTNMRIAGITIWEMKWSRWTK